MVRPLLFFVLLRLEYRDWEKAFYEVIPKRKFEKNKESSNETPPMGAEDALQSRVAQTEGREEAKVDSAGADTTNGNELRSPSTAVEAGGAEVGEAET